MRSLPDQGFAWREAPPATLGFGQATSLQAGAPSAAQADSGQDPTRVGSLPRTDPGFAKGRGEAEPTPALLGFGPATPMQPGAALSSQAESRPDPTRVGSRPDRGFARLGEAAPSPESLGFGPATPLSPGASSSVQAESGPDHTQAGSWPDPGFAR